MAITEGADVLVPKSAVPLLDASNIWTGSPNVFEQGVYVGSGVGSNVGVRRQNSPTNNALQLVNAVANNPTPYLEVAPSDATYVPFRFDIPNRALRLNPDRSARNSSFGLDSKPAANSSGVEWRWWADADSSVVGKNTLALYGYPRDTSGNLLGTEQFMDFDFYGQGDTAGYTKRARLHVQRFVSDGFIQGSSFDTLGIGQMASFGDNDSHFWESTGTGAWRFANRWNIAAAGFEFYGANGAEKRLATLDYMGIASPSGETSLAVQHAGVLKRVYVGAANSAGAGVRLLSVPN